MIASTSRCWLQYLVWLPLGPETAPDDYKSGMLALRQIETWLRDNHMPRALFDKHGRPKSRLVTVSFDETELEKALAYRSFCRELGLSRTLRQNRIVHDPCPRTRHRS